MAKRQRRLIQIFNMSFLDMITNFAGALMILLLISAQNLSDKPSPEIKYNTTAHLDEHQNILWDTLSWRNLKVGDRVLVEIADLQALRTKECSPCLECKRPHYPKPTPQIPCPICPEPGGCSIVGMAVSSECQNDGTYTAEITVRSAGKCAIKWKDNLGHTGIYGEPLKVTFNANEGNKVLYVTDTDRSNITCRVNVFPPKCNTVIGGGGPPPPPAPGTINFKLSWLEKNARINLYVQKDGKWLRAQKEQPFGSIIQTKINKGIGTSDYLPEEQFIQPDKFVPGIYKIFAHYKGVQNKKVETKNTLEVSFTINSKTKPEGNDQCKRVVSLQDKSPISGGGTFITTVVVSNDGSIKFQ
jgi:hypothetical protein